MNIEKTLNEVGIYFKNKVLAGDYVITEVHQSITAKILIDGKYTFEIWLANDPVKSFRFYNCVLTGEINPESLKFNSDEERIQGYNLLKVKLDEHNKNVAKAEKMKQIEQLQKELKEL